MAVHPHNRPQGGDSEQEASEAFVRDHQRDKHVFDEHLIEQLADARPFPMVENLSARSTLES